MKTNKSYMYRQGNGWIVCHWDDDVNCYRASHELTYWQARQSVGTANCRHATDGKCDKWTHDHRP
jgi:hypothetical protein